MNTLYVQRKSKRPADVAPRCRCDGHQSEGRGEAFRDASELEN